MRAGYVTLAEVATPSEQAFSRLGHRSGAVRGLLRARVEDRAYAISVRRALRPSAIWRFPRAPRGAW
jgi:hypothetical protein